MLAGEVRVYELQVTERLRPLCEVLLRLETPSIAEAQPLSPCQNLMPFLCVGFAVQPIEALPCNPLLTVPAGSG